MYASASHARSDASRSATPQASS